MYDTWPCLAKWFFEDTDEVPDPDFSLLLEGGYFTLFVGGQTLYGIAVPPTGDDNTFYCYLFSDSARTQEITTGDYTGTPYRVESFGGWKFENRNRFGARDFSGGGRWRSNPVTVYAPGGRYEGTWVVEDYTESRSAVYFDGSFIPNTLGILGLTLTEQGGGTLPAGTYTVHVSGVDGSGREGGASFEQITVSANAQISVDWVPHQDAVSYNVYLNCQLKESAVTTRPYIIGNTTVEAPTPPPKESDPAIPVNPDDPIIVITPPDNPEGDLPGGKVIVTDPDTGNDVIVEFTPTVPVDESIDGKEILVITEQVGDCLETKTYTDGVQTAWTKVCTDPVTGQKSFCEGENTGETIDTDYNLDLVFIGAPYPITTVEESDDIFDFPVTISLPQGASYPLNIVGSILYTDGSVQIDPDAVGSVGRIRVDFQNGGSNFMDVGDQESNGWEISANFSPVVQGVNNIRVESETTGLPEELPASEWYLKVRVATDVWEFFCTDVEDEDIQEPSVGACRSITQFSNTFSIGGLLFGDRLTEVQCNTDPLNTTWADTSKWSDMLLAVFGLTTPYPRASTRADRVIDHGRQDLHDPRMWTFPLPRGNPIKQLESLYLLRKIDGGQIPTDIKKNSPVFNPPPGTER